MKTISTLNAFSEGGDFVELSGEIFEAGDYPDKGVSFTPDDLKAIAANTERAPLMIEHAPSPLDEALVGYGLSHVEARDGGRKLFGVVRIPTMLNDLLTKAMGERPRKVSVRVDQNRITEVSLVRNPRIPTAAVSAAYSTFAASCGHDPLAKASDTPAKERPPMKSPLKERLKALFRKTDPEALKEAGIDPSEIDGMPFSENPAEGEIERLKASNAALVAGKVEDAAVAFAKDAIDAKKFFPIDKDLLVSSYRNALNADSKGSFQFSATGVIQEGDEVAKLRKSVAERPAMTLTEPRAGGVLTLIPAGTEFSKDDEAKKQRQAYFGPNDPNREDK